MKDEIRPRLKGEAWARLIEKAREIGPENALAMIGEPLEIGPIEPPGDMVLTRETKVEGETKYETYSRRNVEGVDLTGAALKKVWITPQGEVGKTYEYKPNEQLAADLREMLFGDIPAIDIPADYTRHSPAGIAIEPTLFDHHFGKIAYGYEEQGWGLDSARDAWRNAIAFFLSELRGEKIAEIIFPVGNDLLHTNSDLNSTKKGTALEVMENFHALYTYVRDVVTASIVALAKVAPVRVVMVGGNHDEDGVYRLGDYLEGRFYGNDAVQVNNKSYRRKYHPFGLNLIGYTHGEKINIKDIHTALTNDVPHLFAKSKWRYMHIGHLHKNRKEHIFQRTIKDEYQGTEVEICPSLCPADKWHFDNLYTGNQRRAKAFVYDPKKGKVCELYYSM